ncbi:MAG: efflux RND transporter permease subunit [Gemmatimonadaceae bacterium]
MWIVRLALRRPYTFIVGALLVVIFGVLSIKRTPTDILPEIDIPVVSVIWTYNGMAPEEMERRIVTSSERSITTTVNDVEHIESQSLSGVAVIKVFFHPNAKIEAAVAQLAAQMSSLVRVLPPGITPPNIIRFNASNVPILQVALSSETLSEQELYDYGTNFIRTRLATVQGAQLPLPYGGRARAIMVDLDPSALYAKGLSASDVSNAINVQNLILPSGTAKLGEREYSVRLNASPDVLAELNELPVKQVNGAMVYIKDVAQVRDGYNVQANIVRRDGRRGALLTVLKGGGASTLDVVQRVKDVLPSIMATMPASLHAELLADQSIFVRAAINAVTREAVIAACLTAMMILLFLGSWRSTLIVAISIPLSILVSLICLSALGQTINTMTLGGLALAVGILVDDATVGVENIHRNYIGEQTVEGAILIGAAEIAVPTFVSTLSICIVFVPVFFLTGAAKSLFVPLAMAVIFAMLASYVISRTLVPTLLRYAMEREAHAEHLGSGSFARLHLGFDERFERLRLRYRDALAAALANRRTVTLTFTLFCLLTLLLIPFIGEDFFPRVDSGQIRLHVRAPAGTRVEETEQLVASIERTIRKVIPPADLKLVLDNVGIPSSFNLAFSDNPTIGVSDGEILITLAPDRRGDTFDYTRQLRNRLRTDYPQATFFFQAADIVSQILNFGLPAPMDVQVIGTNKLASYAIAREIRDAMTRVPGAADVHVHQVVNAPELLFSVDRIKAGQAGLTQRDVAGNMTVALSSSGQTAPNFWLNPQNGVSYPVSVMTPAYRMSSLEELTSTPIAAAGAVTQLFGNMATMQRRQGLGVVNHYNVQPVFDVYANVAGRDLGGVARDVDDIIAKVRPKLPRGGTIVMRGQVASMRASFLGLGVGLLFAVVLVYLLMVVNFQSWIDPLVIIAALPGALAGIVWILFATQTTLSVPSLMGAIMSVGVATANSILIVAFANGLRAQGRTAMEAALEAGYVRLRPVLMTALAMVIGMLPMALGVGEGAEQNAPLGRAVIGGLLLATVATLFIVPIVYSVFRERQPVPQTVPEQAAA